MFTSDFPIRRKLEGCNKGKPFERLLCTLLNNIRSLECLEEIMKTYGAPPDHLSLDVLMHRLIVVLTQRFNLKAIWSRDGILSILLAISGVPVRPDLSFTVDLSRAVSLRDLELAGVVKARNIGEFGNEDRLPVWSNVWKVQGLVILEVPLALALASLSTAIHMDSELASVIYSASHLLQQFYHNPTSFEELVVTHCALRQSVASYLARLEHRSVSARDLFCGTICHPEFTQFEFKPSIVNSIASVKVNFFNVFKTNHVPFHLFWPFLGSLVFC